MRLFVVFPMFFALAACSSVPQPVTLKDLDNSAIATCGAGFGQGTAAELAAELQKSGGAITASFKQEAHTAIFNDNTLNSSDKQKMYDKYLECLTNRGVPSK